MAIFHVDNYGAVGNGIDDDTKGIRKCTDAAHAAGGPSVIQFRSGGDYVVSRDSADTRYGGAVDLISQCHYTTDGSARATLRYNTEPSEGNWHRLLVSAMKTSHEPVRPHDSAVENLKLVGAINGHEQSHSILHSVDCLRVEDCQFLGGAGDSLYTHIGDFGDKRGPFGTVDRRNLYTHALCPGRVASNHVGALGALTERNTYNLPATVVAYKAEAEKTSTDILIGDCEFRRSVLLQGNLVAATSNIGSLVRNLVLEDIVAFDLNAEWIFTDVEGLTLRRCTLVGPRAGVHIRSCRRVLIEHCTIHRTGPPAWHTDQKAVSAYSYHSGGKLPMGEDIHVVNCDVFASDAIGVQLDDVLLGEVRDCQVRTRMSLAPSPGYTSAVDLRGISDSSRGSKDVVVLGCNLRAEDYGVRLAYGASDNTGRNNDIDAPTLVLDQGGNGNDFR